MKLAKGILVVVALMTLTNMSVWARGYGHGHGGHVRFGVYVGGPAFWPGYYYGPPYYPPYYPAVVGAPYPAAPTYYIEQGSTQPAPAPAPAPSQANWWYHCADAKAYYPYVRECPGGWQRVAPQPLN